MRNSIHAGLITALAIGAISLGSGLPAFAGNGKNSPTKPGAKSSFTKLDTNSDGRVTLAELIARQSARFVAEDSNHNGFLSKKEITAAAVKRFKERFSKRLNRTFAKRDTNDDGRISLTEFEKSSLATRIFTCLDRDGSGFISAKEFRAAKKKARHGMCKK